MAKALLFTSLIILILGFTEGFPKKFLLETDGGKFDKGHEIKLILNTTKHLKYCVYISENQDTAMIIINERQFLCAESTPTCHNVR